MWTTGSSEFTVTTLQHFDVTMSSAENQYWRETSLTNEEG